MDLRVIVAFSALLVFGCNRITQPEIVQSPLQRAVVLFATHRPEKALHECDQVLASEPNHYRALLLRGEICEALDDQDAARKAYTKALQLRPLDAEVRSHLKQLDDQANLLAHQEGATEQEVESESDNVAQPDEAFDEQNQFADEKAYRRLQDDDESAELQPQPQQPTVSAADTHLRRLQLAIAEGRKRDLAAKRASQIAAQGQRMIWIAGPLDEADPRQVTRFDLGMGASVDPHVFQPHVATTGWRRPIEVPEDSEPRRRRAFASQSIPTGGYDAGQRLYDFPLDWAVLDSPSEPNPFVGICQDGIDNNGNGLVDASDPVCWLDGVNPGSYSPYLDEGREFLPPEYFVTPLDIVVQN